MSAPDAGRRGDFLSNVIERANERAPVVRPRPAALFEPVATSLHVDTPTEEAHDSARDGEPREPLKGEPLAPAYGAARRIVPRVSELFDDGGEATVEHRRPESTWTAPRTEVAHNVTHAATQEPVAIQRAFAPPSLLTPNLPTAPPIVSVPARELGRHAAQADVRAPATDEGVGSRLHVREPEPARVARLLPIANIALTAAPASGEVHANRHPSLQQAASAASVTISIGRVEVRAATTPTPTLSARAKGARSPMRLDEYLERRERKR